MTMQKNVYDERSGKEGLIMKRLFVVSVAFMMSGNVTAQDSSYLSKEVRNKPADGVGLYALWYQRRDNPEQ